MAAPSAVSKRHSRKLRRPISSDSISLRNSPAKSLEYPASGILTSEQGSPLSPPGHVYQRPYMMDLSNLEDYRQFGHRGLTTSPVPVIFDKRPPPTAYASLPPTPILPSRPIESLPILVSPTEPVSENGLPRLLEPDGVPFSLWDYLREELLATDFDSHQEMKWERVRNFLSMPWAMEKIIGFGFILCFDSFLYTFTVLPIRFFLALYAFLANMLRKSAPPLPPSQKADLLRALLLITSLLILTPLTDASKIYHIIRGQDTIKLYVIFNALEIADRLCASIGQDILDCLFSRSTLEPLSHRVPFSTHTLRPFLFFSLALAYNVAHALVMMYQLIALNVAINSYDHALLTLLVSNQFVEIKGSVFKKFEKDNLFQITCADIVERFNLALMLFIVAIRNLIELSGTEFDFTGGVFFPKSFGWFTGSNVMYIISYPVLTVMVSEMLVDWLKHAFITKFNHIRPSVYERYIDVLCRDLASMSAVGRLSARKHSYIDQSPLVARRLGFASLPLAALFILIGSQSVLLIISEEYVPDPPQTWVSFIHCLSNAEILRYTTFVVMGLLFWLCFVVIKVIIGVNLVSYATRRRAGMEEREANDAINDFGRDPVGEGKEERAYNTKLKKLLDDGRDDAPRTAEMGENKSGRIPGKKERIKLEDLTRYTMVKRIW